VKIATMFKITEPVIVDPHITRICMLGDTGGKCVAKTVNLVVYTSAI